MSLYTVCPNKKSYTRILVLIFLLMFSFLPGLHAQFGLGIFGQHFRVKLTPANKDYPVDGGDMALKEGYFKEKERWIVFSDRVNNTTYQTPGSEIHLKSLDFMQACYVVKVHGEYLELVKYDARLLKKPGGGIIDRKSADYLGWVHQSRLLLWRTALKENSTGFDMKAISCIKNQDVLRTFDQISIKDSLLIYNSPALKMPKGKVGIENLFYVYKQSDDGKQYLVGKTAQISPDAPNAAGLGWITKNLIEVWGSRPFFTINENTPAPSISFFKDSTITIAQRDSSQTKPFYVRSRDNTAPVLLENIYPALSLQKRDSTLLIKTGVLTDVLDRSENQVINVLGKKLFYNDYRHIVAGQRKTNIVFVVDGGKENGKYMPSVLAVLQNLQLFFDSTHVYRDFNFGAVVYKDNMGAECKTDPLPLTGNYQDLVRFFLQKQQEVNRCNNDTVAQAVFPALIQATKLLRTGKDESNVIVLIGAAGNNMDGADGYADVVDRLSEVNARLLVFQTHSAAHPSFNDFVIQSKVLVIGSAENISEKKKEKLVDLKDVLNNPSFSLAHGDSGIYYLDYPRKSMTQGYVLFPEKGEVMPPSLLEKGLDSLMQKISADNIHVEQVLNRYFNAIGINNTKILAPYQFHYPEYGNEYLPAAFLKGFAFTGKPFYLPANVNYQKNIADSLNNLHFGVLLSGEEYDQVTKSLFDIAGIKDYSKERRRVIYRHIKKVVKGYLSRKQLPVAGSLNQLSFSDILERLTGFKSVNPVWEQTELGMIKDEKKISLQDVSSFLKACKATALWLEENGNNSNIRFINNGLPYYWLRDKQLPRVSR